jgi:predicted ATPase
VPGKIETIWIEGYLSIDSVRVGLRDLNLLIGANGSGKSNFVSALELLGRIVDNDLGLYVGRRGGASSLLHRGRHPARQIVLDIDFDPNGYRAELEPAAGDELVFAREEIRFQGSSYPEPWTDSLGSGHREPRLRRSVDSEGPHSVAAHVLEVLRGCRVFHFHDTSVDAPVKQMSDAANNRQLSGDAANLAPFLRRIMDENSVEYERVRSAVSQVAPFFRDFVLEEERGRMRLRWRAVGVDGDFSADSLSDGTLRFICLATLLLQPAPPQLVVLDEPELGLHPYAIVVLADLLRTASRRCQLVVATQSVSLINQFGVEDLIVVDRTDGASTFSRPSMETLVAWLDDYSAGDLWEKNLLGGRPARERG